MAKAQKGKGEAFAKQAEALLAKKSWFGSGKSQNQEEAAETYEKAANAYKVGGLNQEAGDCYMKSAAIYRDKLSEFMSASKALNQAGGSCVAWIVRCFGSCKSFKDHSLLTLSDLPFFHIRNLL